MSVRALLLLAMLAPLAAMAQKSPRAERTREFLGLGPAPDAAAAERGAKNFTASCAFCHGAKANGGDSGPNLLRSTLVLHDEKGELIGPLIHNGRPDRGMPAFPAFTTAELYDLAQFLHLRVELAANRGTYKLLDVVTGDATAGERWFRGAGGCTACHSATGDLAHIGSHFSPADLQAAFLYPPTKENARRKVTVKLPSGQSWTGTLASLDDFEVAFYDAAGDYHSIARGPGIKVEIDDPLAAHRRLLDRYTDAEMHDMTAYLESLK